MTMLQILGNAVRPIAAAASQGRDAADMAPLVHGAEKGVQAYSRASDAYATLSFDSSVALWALGIAGAAVFVEWLLARAGRRR
jgi:hypothetical protein